MTDRPIIFSGPMVRALLDGRKTQTRRVLKQPGDWWSYRPEEWHRVMDGVAPPKTIYVPGDRMWVREQWRVPSNIDEMSPSSISEMCNMPNLREVFPRRYEADGASVFYSGHPWPVGVEPGRLRPPIHMPQEISRITLNISDVRRERAQDISEADAVAEGLLHHSDPSGDGTNVRELFAMLWNSINGEDAWDRNDWVVALTFTVSLKKPHWSVS